MQVASSDIKTTPRSEPFTQKNKDVSQVDLQRQIDKLNSRITKDNQKSIIERIELINADIKEVRLQHEKEREELKTWGMAPSTWKYIGGGATAFTVLSDLASLASNIPLTIIVDNNTMSIVVTTTVTASVGIVAAGVFAIFPYGQYKVEKRLDTFDQQVRQNELLSVFLNSYQAFMNDMPDKKISSNDIEDQILELKECVEKLKKISSSTVPQDAKDQWLSTMIENLPDDNRLKKTLTEQKELALKIESKKIAFYKSSSAGESYLLNDTNADQTGNQDGDQNSKTPIKDERSLYDKNFNALREEFEMDIQHIYVDGYKLNNQYEMQEVKTNKNHVAVKIEQTKDHVVINI